MDRNKYEGWSFAEKTRSNSNSLGTAKPKVKILRTGRMTINDVALKLIGNPTLVLVGFNPELKLIGIQPDGAEIETENACKYKVSKKLPKDSYITINTSNYLKSIGFPLGEESHVFDAEFREGRLVLEIGRLLKDAPGDAANKKK